MVLGVGSAYAQTSVVINEVDYDQAGTDTAEFIELYNAGTVPVNLDAFTVELVNGTGGGASVYRSVDLPDVDLVPGGFFVLCGSAGTVVTCDLGVPVAQDLVQNGAPDAVGLRDGSGGLVDAVSYEGDTGAPYTEGSGAGLEDDPGVDFAGISRFPDGTDTDQNNVDLSLRCISPGAANLSTSNACNDPNATLQVVINEVDADTPGTDAAEFIELFGSPDTALDGLAVVLYNGNGDVSYAAFDLDGFATDANGFFVLGNTGVANVGLSFPGNTLQNGADAVALYVGDASDFPNGTPVTTANLADAIVYDTDDADDTGLLVLLNAGQPQVNENGGGNSAGDSNQRIPNGTGGRRNTDAYTQIPPTPGAVNAGPPALAEIFEIQGNGLASPFAGQSVTTEDNVVTVLAPDGFFMQTPTVRTDSDPNTSDGIFVFTGGAPGVSVGDVVDVTGTIEEFFDFTEFGSGAAVTVDGPGGSVPAPVVFDAATPSPDPTAPSCSINNFECFEGMLVQVTGARVTGPNQRFNTDPIAEVHMVAGPDRALREKGIAYPGLPGLPVWDGNPEVFELDPDKLGLPNQILPPGSAFTATGVVGFEFGGYELWPTSLTFDAAPLPVPVRDRNPGEATVGSLNLFRLFDDVNDPPSPNPPGPDRDDTVVSTTEYLRRRSKLSRYIVEVLRAPDVLAVQEAEKLEVLQDLAADIAANSPSVVYTAYLVEGNDIGTIDVGFLVRTDRVQVDAVTQLGKAETLSLDGSLLHDRPPLLLEGQFIVNGAPSFPVAVLGVHNRSFIGIDDATDGPRVRQKRLEQAQSIAQKVQDFQTNHPDVGLIVTGDFNDYEFTDGYVDALGQVSGFFDPSENLLSGPDLVDPDLTNQVLSVPADQRYSFIFEGSAQVLDHALASAVLDPVVSGFAYGRGNADAAVDLINDETTLLRASDHDGLVTYLDVTPSEIIVRHDPFRLWPPNHKYKAVGVADIVRAVTGGITLEDVFIVSVTSDEPEHEGGDGNTTDDIVITDCRTVKLRAERQGGGNGRVYTIHVAAVDDAGRVVTAAFPIWAPLSKKEHAVDDGPAYEVLSDCTPSSEVHARRAEAAPEVALLETVQEIPTAFALAPNYPNPFNPATTIEFALPEAVSVSLRVYDVTGREVARLVDGAMVAGTHRVAFDASRLPSGVYLYRLQAGSFTQVHRMTLMK